MIGSQADQVLWNLRAGTERSAKENTFTLEIESMSEPTGRTLSSYRPQHDDECEALYCGDCHFTIGDHVGEGAINHAYEPRACTCGLDLLLAGTREGQDEKDQSRSDQPQPGSCAADPRGGHGTGSEGG